VPRRDSDFSSGTIYKYAPDGTRATFATGLNEHFGLAVDSAGNLFETDGGSGNIYKFAPDGTQSLFASGLATPVGLGFDDAGNLFVVEHYSGNIYKFAPDGTPSSFANLGSGFWYFVAIQPPPRPTYVAQIQQPINSDGSSVFSVRRGVVPVKFTLTQGGNQTCALPAATIALTRTSGGTTGTIDESVYGGSADTGSNFRIDSCQYVYNLSSSALGAGTYRVDILINSQVVGSGIFQLK
jgi:hypothetical protein